MTKRCVLALALAFAPLFALQTAPASACNVVGYKNGERLCSTTYVYKDGRRIVGTYDKKGRHYYPPMVRPGQSSTSNVTPAKGRGCGSGWYQGKDGTCYPKI